ncbi:hypothetical protein G6F24_016520 [Rhizopus arrhizus]|nr:hypothetical protein G6F24_016520 [Rhizopus arrhizus]
MAIAHDHAPVARADADLVAMHDARVARGNGRLQVREIVGALADLLLGIRVGQPVAGEVLDGRLAAGAAAGFGAARRPQGRHHEVRHGHPQPRIPAFAQPVGQADIGGVHVPP